MKGQTDILPASRGFLRREPVIPGESPIWITRPDATTGMMRWTAESTTSFALQKGNAALAGIQLDREGEAPKAWLSSAFEGGDERDVVEVSMALLALTPWPELKPDPPDSSKR